MPIFGPNDIVVLQGTVFVAHDDGTFQCEPCAATEGVDLAQANTWAVGSHGWLAPCVCRSCALSIPVFVDGVPAAALRAGGRFTSMPVPGQTDADEAHWFVYDCAARRTVHCAGLGAAARESAARLAAELNARESS